VPGWTWPRASNAASPARKSAANGDDEAPPLTTRIRQPSHRVRKQKEICKELARFRHPSVLTLRVSPLQNPQGVERLILVAGRHPVVGDTENLADSADGL
jgi:hypothetical protein